MAQRTQDQSQRIVLYRGGARVSTLASAQGASLRETRLTAMLGYLASLAPEAFSKFLGIPGVVSTVSVEFTESVGRSDVRIQTTHGVCVIEAKVTATDALEQSKRYGADWYVLLTQYRVPRNQQRNSNRLRYLRWQDLTNFLRGQTKGPMSKPRFIAEEILGYLQEHRMIRNDNPVEIYAREINDLQTLSMFLHAQMYGCRYAKNSRLPEAMYFAPHFGNKIAQAHPGVHSGISYVAKIEDIEVVQTKADFREAIRSAHGANWLKRHKNLLDEVQSHWQWSDDDKPRSILFLGPPRLIFNPPIKKDNLQAGKGWLSKQFLSFDELFEAWKQ